MFIDEAKIVLKAGDGGNGCMAFQRETRRPLGGPSGGNGGNGGDVFLEADPRLTTLQDFRYHPHYKALDGENGEGDDCTGRGAPALILKVPVGTIVKDSENGEILADLKNPGSKYLAANGGRGGRGNASFKSSTHQAPTLFEKGEPGEDKILLLELKLLADVGLIGFPNAGKSTLLSRISHAHPKIADYEFTTLTPNLGVVKNDLGDSYTVADIPGLIEGAHRGTGLGIQFLRHVERTKLLVHLIDMSSLLDDEMKKKKRGPLEDFKIINKELAEYSANLAKRPQVVVANKMDLFKSTAEYSKLARSLKRKKIECFPISAFTGQGIPELLNRLAFLVKSLAPVPDMEIASKVYKAEARFSIKQEGRDIIVTGKEPVKWSKMTDFGNFEAATRFQTIMQKIGLIDNLKELHVKVGDVVMIEDEEFVWTEEGLISAEEG